MHKVLGVVALAVLLGTVGHSVAQQTAAPAKQEAAPAGVASPAVPDAMQVRMLKLQRDMQGQQSTKQGVAQQANGIIANADKAIEHDQHELDQLKAEALAAAKLDPKEWDVDFDKLVFVKKAAPAGKPAEPPKR
jgi:uncharacterized protein HemX